MKNTTRRRKGGTGSLSRRPEGRSPASESSSSDDHDDTNFSKIEKAASVSSAKRRKLKPVTQKSKTTKSEQPDPAENFKRILAEQNRDVVEWWDARSSCGSKPVFTDANILWNACREYFRWNEEHPLWETKVVSYKGIAHQEPVAKTRAMTLTSLCCFLDIPTAEWDNLRKVPELLPICVRVEEVIFDQKLQGASADLLNANIIARDLKLKDHQEHTGVNGGAIQHENVSSMELAKAIAQVLAKGIDVLDLKPVNVEDTPNNTLPTSP